MTLMPTRVTMAPSSDAETSAMSHRGGTQVRVHAVLQFELGNVMPHIAPPAPQCNALDAYTNDNGAELWCLK